MWLWDINFAPFYDVNIQMSKSVADHVLMVYEFKRRNRNRKFLRHRGKIRVVSDPCDLGFHDHCGYLTARLHGSPDLAKTIRCWLLHWSPDVGKIWSASLGPATWLLRLPYSGDSGALITRNKLSALDLILSRVSITSSEVPSSVATLIHKTEVRPKHKSLSY